MQRLQAIVYHEKVTVLPSAPLSMDIQDDETKATSVA